MNDVTAAARAAALVLQGERSLTDVEKLVDAGCQRPSYGVVWVYPDGRLAPVRCKATNMCDYCAMLTAFENALVVRLDALEGGRWPTWSMTTTTKDAWTPELHAEIAPMLRRAEQSVFQRLRRAPGSDDVQYLGFVEFTTGRTTPGRRPHIHHLVKGLGRPDDDRAAALERLVSETWKSATRGSWRVECRPLRSPLGAIAYLALHHHKTEQRPPEGWTGKRFRPSRGYFNRPIAELRQEARALMADERIERALVTAWGVPDGLDETTLDDLILSSIDRAREMVKECAPALQRLYVRHRPIAVDAVTGEILPGNCDLDPRTNRPLGSRPDYTPEAAETWSRIRSERQDPEDRYRDLLDDARRREARRLREARLVSPRKVPAGPAVPRR